MPLSLIEAHTKIIKTIPTHRKSLIEDLELFMINAKNKPTDKNLYTQYLRIILKYVPKRELTNKDPEWMWNCQDAFSSSFNNESNNVSVPKVRFQL